MSNARISKLFRGKEWDAVISGLRQEFASDTFEESVRLIQETMDSLERKGLVQKTGEFRDGIPVYVLSRKGLDWCGHSVE